MSPFFTMRSGRPDLSRILARLLVGAYPTVVDAPWLAATHGVGAVLSLQDDADLAAKRLDAADLAEAYAAAGIAFARLPVPDGDEERMVRVLPAAVARVAAFVAEGTVVYVHCNAGMNRAPTVAIAYVHVHEGRSLAAATRLVKSRRPCVPFQSALARVYAAPHALRPPSR
jgi:protein-tyrosine phosphatase